MAFRRRADRLQRELDAARPRSRAAVSDMIFAARLGGMLGAKLYYVVVLTQNWDALFTRGGFVFWGGFIGGMLAVLRRRSGARRFRSLRFSDVGGIGDRGGATRSDARAAGRSATTTASRGQVASSPCVSEGRSAVDGRRHGRDFGVQFPPATAPNTVRRGVSDAAHRGRARLRDVRHPLANARPQACRGLAVRRVLRARRHRAIHRRVSSAPRTTGSLYGGLSTAQVIAIVFTFGGCAWMWWRRDVTATKPGIYASGVVQPTPVHR